MKQFHRFLITSTVTALGVALSLWSDPAISATQNHKAHVHGAAKLTLAVENANSANIDLDVPGDSVFGFEHKARSASDKKTQEGALEKLRSSASEVIRFAPALGCVVKAEKVGLEKEDEAREEKTDEHHGEHEDVNASYTVQCAQSLAGSKISIGLIQLFPKIKNVSLQILTPSGQTQKSVHDAKESVAIPAV